MAVLYDELCKQKILPVGLEPTIYCLEGSRLIHWARGAFVSISIGNLKLVDIFAVNLSVKPPVGIEPTIYCLEGSRLIHWATGAGL